ncbi:hypothetical protein [Actinocrispum sp. NPDC049592]|uniref:hypothetical protein n=1 Tax=Actinocrispum sp. NPDC049592 TaxID=3154835 RepID=UPI003422F590
MTAVRLARQSDSTPVSVPSCQALRRQATSHTVATSHTFAVSTIVPEHADSGARVELLLSRSR